MEKSKCKWKVAAIILCIVGLLKEFRPSGPFLVDYALDFKNFTLDQITHEVLPSTTASYFISLIFILLVTDALCYKPIIVMGTIMSVITWILTSFYYDSVVHARIRQVTYGISVITIEVAYFTYMYANIEKSDCKVVTSYTHSAIHFGQFLSGVVGQLLLSFKVLGLNQINYLSLGGAIGSFLFALLIPKVFKDYVSDALDALERKEPSIEDKEKAERKGKESLNQNRKNLEAKEKEAYNEQKSEEDELAHNREKAEVKEKEANDEKKPEENELNAEQKPRGLDYRRNINKEISKLQKWKEAPILAKENLIYAYSDMRIIKWSLWWILAYALYIQVDLYIETLWKEIEHHSHQKVFNGAVHASHAIISVVLGLIIGRVKLSWTTWGAYIFGIATIIQGYALCLMAETKDLYYAYGCFILYQTFFQVLIIIIRAEVAEHIKEGSEAFIFGINTLFAIVIHFVLTFAVVGKHGFRLAIREQHLVYAAYAFILGTAFLVFAVIVSIRMHFPNWRSWSANRSKVATEIYGKTGIEKEEECIEECIGPNVNSMPYSLPREN